MLQQARIGRLLGHFCHVPRLGNLLRARQTSGAAAAAATAASKKGVVLVVGAGNGTGGAVAKRFASEGFTVCVTRRKVESLLSLVKEIREAGGTVRPFGCDARNESQVQQLVETIERDIGAIEVAVFNIGANVRVSESFGNLVVCRHDQTKMRSFSSLGIPLQVGITETTSRVFRKVWEMAAFAGVCGVAAFSLLFFVCGT